MRAHTVLLALCAACAGTPDGGRPDRVVDLTPDDSAPDDSGGGDSGPDDSGTLEVDTAPQPTVDTYPEAEVVTPSNLCHPFDPVEVVGWTRTYEVTIAGGEVVSPKGSVVELHTAKGAQPVPDLSKPILDALGLPNTGWSHDVTVQTNGSASGVIARHWQACGGGTLDPHAPFRLVTQLQAVGGSRKVNLIAGERFAHLGPPEAPYQGSVGAWGGRRAELANWWNAFCGRDQRANRTLDEVTYPAGLETITVAGLGEVEAWHVTVMTRSVLSERTDFACLFGDLFGDVFGEIFGTSAEAIGPDIARRTQVDRWYVEGVGLVRESTLDLQEVPTEVRRIELTDCTVLPGCP
ncbi:MAG: hypothetical protein H6732_10385 [Alphaproteobacteria bacterium]|nr:hypothetical protein [Alphaproteobacteria bacterium]